MGSDHAPNVEIDGALAAARDFGIGVILVGQPEKIEPCSIIHSKSAIFRLSPPLIHRGE